MADADRQILKPVSKVYIMTRIGAKNHFYRLQINNYLGYVFHFLNIEPGGVIKIKLYTWGCFLGNNPNYHFLFLYKPYH